MAEPILVPTDTEGALVQRVAAVLAEKDLDVPVDIKDTLDVKSFVSLYRTGGAPGTAVSDRAQITFNAYAPTEYQAYRLGAIVFGIAVATDCLEVDGVFFYENSPVGSLANFPNPRHPTLFRYQFSRTFHTRSQEL